MDISLSSHDEVFDAYIQVLTAKRRIATSNVPEAASFDSIRAYLEAVRVWVAAMERHVAEVDTRDELAVVELFAEGPPSEEAELALAA